MESIAPDTKILICEPQFLLGYGLEAILEFQYPDVRTTLYTALDRKLFRLLPEGLRVLIIDPLFACSDANLLTQLRRELPEMGILGLCSTPLDRLVEQYFDECIYPTQRRESIVRTVAQYLLEPREGRRDMPQLTDRETEVLRQLVLGKTAKEIGKALYISEHTVTTHRKKISAKLGIKSVAGLTIYALSTKLVLPSDLAALRRKGER